MESSIARVSFEQSSKGSEEFSHVAILENSRRRDSMYKTVLYSIFKVNLNEEIYMKCSNFFWGGIKIFSCCIP